MKHLNKFKIFEKKITIKQSRDFKIDADDIIEKFGGIPRSDAPYEWMVETIYGPLMINVDDNAKTEIYSIFMRFAFPEKSKNKVDCNPHSGKWNIHISDYNIALNELKNRLEEVEGKSPNVFDNDISIDFDKDDLPF